MTTQEQKTEKIDNDLLEKNEENSKKEVQILNLDAASIESLLELVNILSEYDRLKKHDEAMQSFRLFIDIVLFAIIISIFIVFLMSEHIFL